VTAPALALAPARGGGRPCQRCALPLSPDRAVDGRVRYCSEECRREAGREQARAAVPGRVARREERALRAAATAAARAAAAAARAAAASAPPPPPPSRAEVLAEARAALASLRAVYAPEAEAGGR
jgi:hypothetical protein